MINNVNKDIVSYVVRHKNEHGAQKSTEGPRTSYEIRN